MTDTRRTYEMAEEVIHDLGVMLGTIDLCSDEGVELHQILDRALDEVDVFQDRVESDLVEESEADGA